MVHTFRVETYNGERFTVRAGNKETYLRALEARNLRVTNVKHCKEVGNA